MTKAEVRRVAGQRVAQLSAEERLVSSVAVARSVLALPEVASATVVMAFLPLADEVETWPLIRGLVERGTVVAVPHTDVVEGALVPVRLRADATVRPAALDVPEPTVHEAIAVEDIEVVVVPGRAFDRAGHRVGRGRGFYDRFLGRSECSALRVAIAYECQVFEVVPHGEGDVPVDVLVTEAGVLRLDR